MDEAAFWDDMARKHGGVPPAEGRDEAIGALLARLGPDDRVLDVGCGNGSIAALVAPHVLHVHGIDVSPKMLLLAKQHENDGLTFSLGTLDDAHDGYTAIMMFNAVHHLDIPATLRRCREVLGSGGLLFLFESQRHGHHEHHEGPTHPNQPMAPGDLEGLLDPAHFDAEFHAISDAAAWVAARVR